MEKELIENILKVPFLEKKMDKVKALYKENNLKETYLAIATLIEMVSIILLEKKFDKKVEDSNIVLLANMLETLGEDDIFEILVSINAEYNDINLNKVDNSDVIDLVLSLDEIVKIILDKYGNIF